MPYVQMFSIANIQQLSVISASHLALVGSGLCCECTIDFRLTSFFGACLLVLPAVVTLLPSVRESVFQMFDTEALTTRLKSTWANRVEHLMDILAWRAMRRYMHMHPERMSSCCRTTWLFTWCSLTRFAEQRLQRPAMMQMCVQKRGHDPMGTYNDDIQACRLTCPFQNQEGDVHLLPTVRFCSYCFLQSWKQGIDLARTKNCQ